LRSPGHDCAQAFDERNADNTPNEMAAVVANDVMERNGFMERLLYELWLNGFNKNPRRLMPVYEQTIMTGMTPIQE
jgi:hypothetical protein